MFRCCCSSSNSSKGVLLGALVAAAATIGVAYFTTGNDEPAPPATEPAEASPAFFQPEAEMTPEQMMAFMQDWAAPVEQHEVLKQMVGSWDATTSFTMDPSAPPVEGTGSSESALILGGRYVTQHFTMPDFMGMEFEGYGAVGYDKAKGKFINVWLDNFSTGITMMEGEYDADSQTMTWTGNAVYPVGEGMTAEVPVKHVVRHKGDDKMVMEFWEPNPETGEMMHNGTITYTRR